MGNRKTVENRKVLFLMERVDELELQRVRALLASLVLIGSPYRNKDPLDDYISSVFRLS